MSVGKYGKELFLKEVALRDRYGDIKLEFGTVGRHGELRAHHQSQDPREQEEQERGADIENADIIVIDFGDEANATRRVPQASELLEFTWGTRNAIRQAAHLIRTLLEALQIFGERA